MTTQQSMKTSDESNARQLDLADEQGKAFKDALTEMTRKEAHGKSATSGDYLIGVAVENAEGLYEMQDGSLKWREPSKENAHIEVVVCDARDTRFLPGLDVEVEVLDGSGKQVGRHKQPFLWHPWLYHYGRNWEVPGEGDYTFRVHVEPPPYMRHDKVNGKRFAAPADVEFKGIHIKPGRKIS